MRHTITAEELRKFISIPDWCRYASSSSGSVVKILEYSRPGVALIFRVKRGKDLVFEGIDLESAVEAYNDLP